MGAIKKKRKNLVFWTKQGGGGLTESQLFVKFFQNQICLGTVHKCDETHTTQMGRQYLKFLSNFSKTKFALELSINVMKHTLHKWGGNISSIHNVIGPPKKITARLGKKKTEKVGPIPKRG